MIQKSHYCTHMQRTYGQIDTCSYMFTKDLSTTINYNLCAIYLVMVKKIWFIHNIQQEKGWNSVIYDSMDRTGDHYVKWKRKTQKGKYFMISLTCEIEKGWSHRSWEHSGGCQWEKRVREERRVSWSVGSKFPVGARRSSMLSHSLETTESYTLFISKSEKKNFQFFMTDNEYLSRHV